MTYSLAITGAPADSRNMVETLVLPDGGARTSELAQAAMLGTPLLCKRADGSTGYYVVDAERSTPDVPVLRAL